MTIGERAKSIFFLPPEEANKKHRLYYLDGFRSIALILMILSHGLKFWINPATASDTVNAYKILLTKLPAPMFFLMVGGSYILSSFARKRKGHSPEAILLFFLRRSAILFLLAFVYKGVDILFLIPWRAICWWDIDVLNIIAISLGLIGIFDYLTRKLSNQSLAFLFIALLSASLHPLLFRPYLDLTGVLPEIPRLYIQGTQAERAWFTIFPYAGYAFFGAWLTKLLMNGLFDKAGFRKFIPAAILSLFSLSGFVLENMATNEILQSIGFKTFYFCRAYAMLFISVFLAYLFQKHIGFGPFLIAGSYTMVGYWVHAKVIYLLYNSYGAQCGVGFSFFLLLQTYALTFLVLFGWAAFRRRKPGLQKRSPAV